MRDKLINILCAFDGIGKSCGFPTADCKPCEELADFLIANGVTFATDNNVPCKWIPVSERLPEKSGLYLVCKDLDISGREDKVIEIERYIEMWDGWYIDGCKITNITHWAYLPEAPKEGE